MSAKPGPFVSIVTPCLNPGPRLERCLASVAAQTYPHLEHLVIDGSSTDGTVELLAGSAGVRWVSEPDGGQTEAINKGFRMAKGEILAWLNADDVLTPDSVSRVVAAFSGPSHPGWVYGDSLLFEGSAEHLHRPPAPLAIEDLDSRNPMPQPACFMARWALDEVGALDEGLDLAMDLDLWYRLVGRGITAAYVPATLAVIEVHPAAKSRARSGRAWAEENGMVRLRHGRIEAGALSLGRSAAHAAAVGGRVDRRRLATAVQSVDALATAAGAPVPTGVVRAAAFTEAAVIERGRRLLRWRHLVSLDPWRCRLTRQLILGVGRSRARATPHLHRT